MVPSPDLITPFPTTTWPDGLFHILTTWPDAPGIDYTLYIQLWAPDASAPFGWLSSNAWTATQYGTL